MPRPAVTNAYLPCGCKPVLRGMVRLIVGALAWVGKEKLPLSVFEEVLATKGKIPRSFSAPANGLFLSEVRYPYIVND